MTIIGINKDLCIECGECVHECPARLFNEKPMQETTGVINFSDPADSCIRCGHCIAVCPANAMEFNADTDTFVVEGIEKPESVAGYETIFAAAAIRRSIRRFRQNPVENMTIKKIFDILRLAPSASNSRRWEYIVVTAPDIINTLRTATINMMKKGRMLLRFRHILRPFLRGSLKRLATDASVMALNKFMRRIENGEDPVFFNAPCLLILHSPAYANMAGPDAGIALTHAILAAQGLGLGTCWIGFAQEMLVRNSKERARLGIPSGRQVYGRLALGYPAVKYYRVPPRSPVEVRWLQ